MTRLLLAVALAASGGTPGVPQEEWDETLALLAAADAAASARELAELAGPLPSPGNLLGWQRRRRPDGQLSDMLRIDLRSGSVSARLRRRAGSERSAEVTGAVRLEGEGGSLTAGWWSWRAGFGLLAGASGRRPGLTADGGLQPARPGPGIWTGSPEPRARRGAAASLRLGPWRLGGAWGPARGPEDGPVAVATAGRADGGFTATAVAADGVVRGVGADGRWESAAWRGAWELVWRAEQRTAVPAASAVALDWRPGRQVGLAAIGVVATGGPASPLAAAHELAGGRGGDGWAVRGSWAAAPRVRFLALVSDRRRRRDGPGHERRRLLELQARYRTGDGTEVRVRYRGSATGAPVWDPDWPWEAPRPGPSPRRRALGLTVTRRHDDLIVRADLRTLALSDTGTPGRRSLLGLELRRSGARGTVLRVGWHEAWGDPVDLVSAISPLPGRLVPRHWGAWRGELWAGVALRGRRHLAGVACHLRRPRLAGRDAVEVRAEAQVRW